MAVLKSRKSLTKKQTWIRKYFFKNNFFFFKVKKKKINFSKNTNFFLFAETLIF